MTLPRFQSQSFNWLNRQRLRWNDRLQQSWRSFQVAVSWGTQMLLYPLYIAIQSSRLLLHHWQARQDPVVSLPGEPSPQVEPTSQTALTVFEEQSGLESQPLPDFVDLFFSTLSKSFTFKPRSTPSATGLAPLTEQPQIQGIASLRLGNATYPQRSLVWVDDRNQLWSIPLAHQQAFQYKILTIVANHTPLPRATPLKLLPDRSQQLPPVRWLNRLVNWMQTSSLAQSTNLFQERQIQPLALPAAPFPNPLPPQWQQRVQKISLSQGDALLRFVDYHLALLEPQVTVDVSIVPSTDPVSRDPAPMDLAPVDPVPPLPVAPTRLRKESLRQPSLASPALVQPEFQTMSKTTTGDDRKLPAIGSSPVVSVLPVPSPPQPPIPQPIPSLSSAFDLDSAQGSPTFVSVSPPVDANTPLETQPPNPHPRESLPPSREQDIEVQSEAIGYEHHPLEQLLHWIDRIVTWLEHQVAKLWGSVE